MYIYIMVTLFPQQIHSPRCRSSRILLLLLLLLLLFFPKMGERGCERRRGGG